MGLIKVKAGSNMYQGWITHCHSHLLGKCRHFCKYCYTQAIEKRFQSGRYSGDVRLNGKEFDVSYGKGKTIFIEHMNDLFSKGIPDDWIVRILEQCKKYPDNEYIFQTKNPENLLRFVPNMPVNYMVGTTAESDIVDNLYGDDETKPPDVLNRLAAMMKLPIVIKRFITVEPMVKLGNTVGFAKAIAICNPDFVNIGIDSKGSDLEDPAKEQILEFVEELQRLGVKILKKSNLGRVLGT